MPRDLRQYRIFIASPSGLEIERELLCEFIQKYNAIEADSRGLHFKIVRWEDIPPEYGRPQDTINRCLVECDYFILVLWNRWGMDAGGGGPQDHSGSEEEFRLAEECLRDSNRPMRNIVVYFKVVDPTPAADSDAQFRRVAEFKTELESNHKLMYGTFSNPGEFSTRMWRHLAQWTRDNEKLVDMPKGATVADITDPTQPHN